MSWLAPLYLLGALAIAGPIVFHLWRRAPQGRLPFSTLMFLDPSPPRMTRLSRVEHWLLLLLRAAVVLLIALAFARPVWRVPASTPTATEAGAFVAIVVDRSASMQRAGLWDQVQRALARKLEGLAAADTPALFVFDDHWEPVASFAETERWPTGGRSALLLERLQGLRPTQRGTRLGLALMETAQALQEAQTGRALPRPQRIWLVSDLQSGADLSALQGFDWPREIPVEWVAIRAESPTNAGLQLVGSGAEALDDALRVRITNAAESAKDRFVLRWGPSRVAEPRAVSEGAALDRAASGGPAAGGPVTQDAASGTEDSRDAGRTSAAGVVAANGASQNPALADAVTGKLNDAGAAGAVIAELVLPAGQSRVIALPRPSAGNAGDKVVLEGDDHPFDNTLWLPRQAPVPCTVVYLGDEQADDPSGLRFYFERALAANPRYAVTVLDATTVVTAAERPALVVASACDPESPGAKLLARQRDVVLVPPTAAASDALFAAAGWPIRGATEAVVGDFALWSQIDFESPWFAPFSEAQFADFSGVHFWRHRRLPDDAWGKNVRVLVRFDDGDPAMAEFRAEDRRLWWFASGWQPRDSQLARSSKYVPLVWRVLEHAMGDRPLVASLTVGQALATRASRSSEPRRTESVAASKDGEEGAPRERDTAGLITVERVGVGLVSWPATAPEVFAEEPGMYLRREGTTVTPIAVNLPPQESRTDPLPPEQLEALGVTFSTRAVVPAVPPTAEQLRQQQLVELEQRQQLWRWGLLAAVGLLMLEMLVSGWRQRVAVGAVNVVPEKA